jgi:hypothetical protein
MKRLRIAREYTFPTDTPTLSITHNPINPLQVTSMALLARDEGKTFTPAPAGVYNAVCVDVVDKGMQPSQFGIKHKIVIVWEIDEQHPSFDRRFTVNRQYTLSLNEKATLSKDLESWRGKPFTKEEREGFDVERLIGAPCMVNIAHKTENGNTYANVISITPVPKGMQRLNASPDYTRVMDRNGGWDVRSPKEDGSPAGGDGAAEGDFFKADDDLPF